MRTAPILAMSAAVIVAACGGGGGGDPEEASNPPPAVAGTGQFKDGNVEGLGYRTATRSGTTDALGRFAHAPGEMVTFSLGGLELGSAPAQAIVTPIDLVPDGRSDAEAVLNRVRLLMMLDRDGDPGNGLTISATVQAAAAGWGGVDFASAGFDGALAGVIADVAAADGRTPVLPDPAAARAHLEDTVHCTTSGVYVGTYSGTRSGPVLLLQRPGSGQWVAQMDGGGAEFSGVVRPAIDRVRGFALERAIDGARLTVRIVDGALAGTWQAGADSGEFRAEPALSNPSAAYRFTGLYWYNGAPPDLQQFQVFEVDAQGRLEGRSGHPGVGDVERSSGRLRDRDLSYTVSTGAVGEGTVDPETLNVLGSWTGERSGGFEATGCRLN